MCVYYKLQMIQLLNHAPISGHYSTRASAAETWSRQGNENRLSSERVAHWESRGGLAGCALYPFFLHAIGAQRSRGVDGVFVQRTARERKFRHNGEPRRKQHRETRDPTVLQDSNGLFALFLVVNVSSTCIRANLFSSIALRGCASDLRWTSLPSLGLPNKERDRCNLYVRT